MKTYLASPHTILKFKDGMELAENLFGAIFSKPYILESFYYCNEDTERLIPMFGDFLLDSGAFSFMHESKGKVDWEAYLEQYIAFINRNKIKKFFELDIDYQIGYERVKVLRRKLENATGVQPIPVWHKTRGLDEFKRMCEEYSYVAVGASGINEDSKWTRKNPELLRYLVKIAHANKSKIHGLGYSSVSNLKTMHFDSVDSTAWTTGNRFGFIWRFTGDDMEKVAVAGQGRRIGDSRAVAFHNYKEWIKFQDYAERRL